MAKVGIVMGSESDMPIMAKVADVLDDFGVSYEMRIISAHRNPDVLEVFVEDMLNEGCKVIVAGAGKAAALPGVCASMFPLPVVGVPIKTSDLGGVDSLYSIVQMPKGVPVATVAINGSYNAGLLAVQILATHEDELLVKLEEYKERQREQVIKKDEKLQKEGRKVFL